MIRTVLWAIVLMAPNSAFANWHFQTAEDPMTDQITAMVSSVSDTGVGLGFKCWDKQPNETILVVTTPSAFDATASYKDPVTLTFRVDKGDRTRVMVSPKDLNGTLSFVSQPLQWVDVLQLMKSIGAAKQRVALAIGSLVMTFPARGSTAAVTKFSDTCGVSLTAEPDREEATGSEEYVSILDRPDPTPPKQEPATVQIASSPPITLEIKAGNYTADDATKALTIFRENCSRLDAGWSDVESVSARISEEYASHRLAKGWKHTLSLAVKLSDNPKAIPSFDDRIGVIAGHTLHYDIGGGAAPGMFASKRVSQLLCGMKVNDNGADVFVAVPEFGFLARD